MPETSINNSIVLALHKKFQPPKRISCCSHIFCGIHSYHHKPIKLYYTFMAIIFSKWPLQAQAWFPFSDVSIIIDHVFIGIQWKIRWKMCGEFWVLSLGFPSFLGANLLLVQCYTICYQLLQFMLMNYNGMYYLSVYSLGQAQQYQALLKVPCLGFSVVH